MSKRKSTRRTARKIVRVYPCEVCPKEFESSLHKQQHLLLVHNALVAVDFGKYTLGVHVVRIDGGFKTTSLVFAKGTLNTSVQMNGKSTGPMFTMFNGDSAAINHEVLLV